jgi:hypothetical protein
MQRHTAQLTAAYSAVMMESVCMFSNSVETMPQSRWNTADLLDLEFLLQQDEGEDMARLAARDREIFAALPEQEAGDALLLRGWLERRKLDADKDSGAMPGSLWQELVFLCAIAAGLAGLSAGSGLAFSFLAYSGAAPVNVAAYFAVFVLLQLGLLLLLAASVLCGRLRGADFLASSLLYRLAGRLFFWLSGKCAAAGRRASSHFAAEQRLSWAARAGSLGTFRQRRSLLLRPLFLLAQLFGISFNVGVLAATLLKVIGSDLAFGWQTTLQVDAAAVHALTGWISLPWCWLPESVPSLAQIDGSRLILKDGIYHLASRDLASWWPFLCLSVLCYGLLPRLLLLAAGLLRQREELAQFDPQQGRFRQLVHRMRTPLVSTAAVAAEARQGAAAGPPEESFAPESRLPPNKELPPVAVLIPDELFAACPTADLAELLRRRAGYQLGQAVPFGTLDKSEAEELASLKEAMAAQPDCKDVVILHEAWQPPVQELLTWLAGLRRALGPQPVITLALIGRPAAENLLTPPQPEQVRIWRQKTAALGDSSLHVIELC